MDDPLQTYALAARSALRMADGLERSPQHDAPVRPLGLGEIDVTDLRVALFSGNYNYVRDGANKALNKLADYLLGKGAQVRVYSPTVDEPAFEPAGDLVSVPSFPFPGRSEYRLAMGLPRRIRRDVRDFAPNIFHVSAPELLGHRAVTFGRRLDLPVIASVHTRFDTYFRYYGLGFIEPLIRVLSRRFYRRCDAIVAPSESMAQLLREQRMNYDVGIWSRGIDREIFNPERRDPAWLRARDIADREPVIGFVGRLVMEKGLDVFADTIDRLAKRGVDHRVLIVGDGPARGWFEQRLPGAVFTGHLEAGELATAVASMDMLFNPSITETFGNVTLEAMASGLPVVAARAPGSQSLVSDGLTGRLIRAGACDRFADALAIYCRNADARRAAGAAGLLASRRYTWEAVNQELVETYLRLIRQHRLGGRQP